MTGVCMLAHGEEERDGQATGDEIRFAHAISLPERSP